MMNLNSKGAKNVEAVTHTHTHTLVLENKKEEIKNNKNIYLCNEENCKGRCFCGLKKETAITRIALIIIITLIIIFFTIGIVLIQKGTIKEILNKQELKKLEETDNIEAVYRINKIDEENKIDITIVVEHKTENIEYIITPEKEKINFNNKKKVAIDYKIEKDQDYEFKIKMENGQEETYTLNENGKPDIKDDGFKGYATIKIDKIEYPEKTITIDYGDNTQNYYSIDNGETWTKYEENFKIQVNSKCTILAKSKEKNKINKIEQKEIDTTYKDDAINYDAIDNDFETCMKMHQNIAPGTAIRYINIDSSLWDKQVRIKWWNWYYGGYYSTIECLDENDEVLQTYRIGSSEMRNECYDIPKNTIKLKYFVRFADAIWASEFGELFEIQPQVLSPEIIKAFSKITSEGVVKQSFKIKTDEDATTYYKIDSNEWKLYSDEEQIFVEIGQTLYAKSTYKQTGIYFTEEVSYTNNEEIGKEAYDKDDDTYVVMQYETYPGTATRYLDIDESIWGKKLRIKWWNWYWWNGGYYSTIKFLDNEGNALATYTLNNGETKDENYDIPSGSVRLEYFVAFAGNDSWSREGFGKLFEIEVKD